MVLVALEPGGFELGRLLHDKHVVGRGGALGLVHLGLFAPLSALFARSGFAVVCAGAGERELHAADALEERARGGFLSCVFQLRCEQRVKVRGLLRRPGERGVGGGHGERGEREGRKGEEDGKSERKELDDDGDNDSLDDGGKI